MWTPEIRFVRSRSLSIRRESGGVGKWRVPNIAPPLLHGRCLGTVRPVLQGVVRCWCRQRGVACRLPTSAPLQRGRFGLCFVGPLQDPSAGRASGSITSQVLGDLVSRGHGPGLPSKGRKSWVTIPVRPSGDSGPRDDSPVLSGERQTGLGLFYGVGMVPHVLCLRAPAAYGQAGGTSLDAVDQAEANPLLPRRLILMALVQRPALSFPGWRPQAPPDRFLAPPRDTGRALPPKGASRPT